jgi:elongation factor G
VQTDVAWAHADRSGVSRLVVVNRLDRENASFDRVLESLRGRFGTKVAPIQIPIGSEGSFDGVVDLLEMKAYYLAKNGEMTADEIPADLRARAQAAREKLMEAAAETDDALVEKYLETGELSQEELTRGLHVGVKGGALVPVLCAAATRLIGIPLILNEIVTLLPGPTEGQVVAAVDPRGGQQVSVPPQPDGPLAALVFKTVADPHGGKISYFRVYGGTFRSDAPLLNGTRGKPERVGQVYFVRGKHQEPAQALDRAISARWRNSPRPGPGTRCAGRTIPSGCRPSPSRSLRSRWRWSRRARATRTRWGGRCSVWPMKIPPSACTATRN